MTRRASRSWASLVWRQASAPFDDPAGGKGPWTRITRAGRHVLASYRLTPDLWPLDFPPLRVALLSDCHMGSHAGDVERHRAICAEINRLEPDLVLLLGDYVNLMPLFGGRVPPETIAEVFSTLVAPLGVHAVLGNHDWQYGGEEVARALVAHGITVHENSGVRLDHHGRPLQVCGLADTVNREPDMAAALSGVDDGVPAIVMSHDPACFAALPRRPAVMVSGHTHGGQWRFPFLGPLWIPGAAPLRWAHGVIQEDGRTLIVSAGTGTCNLPLRINCPPEIVLVGIGG